MLLRAWLAFRGGDGCFAAMPNMTDAERHSRSLTPRRPSRWPRVALTLLLAVAAGAISYTFYPGRPAAPVADLLGPGVFTAPDLASMAPGLLGQGQVSTFAPSALPAPIVTATAGQAPGKHKPKPTVHPSPPRTPAGPPSTVVPVGGASYAGSLILNATGSQLTSWNQTASYCPQTPGFVPDGAIGTDSSGNATLTTTGTSGSCAALISPGAYASNVVEADMYYPALPGQPDSIANWTGLWMTDGATWPVDGEIDATESEPINGVDSVSWHSGTADQPFVASTDGFFPTTLPRETGDITPGWHTVDIVYTKGFFAVYYDGKQYTSYTSDNVTGSPLNIYFTIVNTPDTGYIQQRIGGSPVNSDGSSPTYAVKDVRVWSYKLFSVS
jgi:hypothetical protein